MSDPEYGTIEWALGQAAQAWCYEGNDHKEMDPALATAFAEILVKEVNQVSNLEGQRNLLHSCLETVKNFFDPEFITGLNEADMIKEINRILEKVNQMDAILTREKNEFEAAGITEVVL